VRQRDQIAALAVRAGLGVIDAKAAGVIAIVSIGPNMGTAPAGRYRGVHVQSAYRPTKGQSGEPPLVGGTTPSIEKN
jgi:hypothetical protein